MPYFKRHARTQKFCVARGAVDNRAISSRLASLAKLGMPTNQIRVLETSNLRGESRPSVHALSPSAVFLEVRRCARD